MNQRTASCIYNRGPLTKYQKDNIDISNNGNGKGGSILLNDI
jgi:hypothetical protein